jgi:hypothetical protein
LFSGASSSSAVACPRLIFGVHLSRLETHGKPTRECVNDRSGKREER